MTGARVIADKRSTIYVSIGNSDDKLTQYEWSEFQRKVGQLIENRASVVHGAWVSVPLAPFQNACWCFVVDERQGDRIADRLADLAREYRQDSIAWAMAEETVFIKPTSGLELAHREGRVP